MNTIKKVFKIVSQVLTIILFAFLILAIYTKVQMIFLKRNYATIFGYTLFQVASGSMEPALEIDDVILVKENEDIKVDDIISYEDNGTIITHRVISINDDILTVKGDANNTIDIPINRSDIIGKVVNVYPDLKIWQDILSNPKILVTMFITLLLFDFAFSYKKKEKVIEEKVVTEKEEIKIVQVNSDKDIIETDELLELTRKIDLKELDEILKKEKLEQSEKNELYNTLVNLRRNEIKKYVLPKLKEKYQNKDDYTIRLDLSEIQREIEKNMK